jgi:hypothetical protein
MGQADFENGCTQLYCSNCQLHQATGQAITPNFPAKSTKASKPEKRR